MEGDELSDDERLLRFLHPRATHVILEAGEYRVTTTAFLDDKARTTPRLGRSLFVESGSDLARLEQHFRIENHHGLARIRVHDARECGFGLLPDRSELFPDDEHVLLRPNANWSRGEHRVQAAKLATLAVIDYLPIV